MDKIIKKLETIVKCTNDTRINVDITDLQRIIQEIKNQDKIINETAREKDYYKKKYDDLIEYYKRSKDCNEEFEL